MRCPSGGSGSRRAYRPVHVSVVVKIKTECNPQALPRSTGDEGDAPHAKDHDTWNIGGEGNRSS